MSDPNQSQLILAVPGPEQMRAYPKEVVKAAIVNGEIAQSQLIWSPVHSEWKKLRELIDLYPAQEEDIPSAEHQRHQAEGHQEGDPQSENAVKTIPFTPTPVADRADSTNAVRIAPNIVPQVRPQTRTIFFKKQMVGKKEIKDFEESHISLTTWIILFLTSIILGTLGSNYVLVDTPFRDNLTRYELDDLPLHAHLVSFYRSDMILFHLFPDPRITEENLPNLLVMMAKSTPNQALSGLPFAWVSFTKGWYSQYSLPGESWAKLSTMDKASRNEKIAFLLEKLEDKNGDRLLKPVIVDKPSTPAPNPVTTELSDVQKKAWDQFAYSLVQ